MRMTVTIGTTAPFLVCDYLPLHRGSTFEFDYVGAVVLAEVISLARVT